MSEDHLSRWQVAFDSESVAITGRIYTKAELDQVIKVLAAQRPLLPPDDTRPDAAVSA